MTKLTDRIVEVAKASGKTVYIGFRGYKGDDHAWFAGVTAEHEYDGSSPDKALEAVVRALKREADLAKHEARITASLSEKLSQL